MTLNYVFGKAGVGYNLFNEKKVKKSLLISFPRVNQVIYLWLVAIIVWEKCMFLKVTKLENMMYLRDIWKGSQKDKERINHVGPNLSRVLVLKSLKSQEGGGG